MDKPERNGAPQLSAPGGVGVEVAPSARVPSLLERLELPRKLKERHGRQCAIVFDDGKAFLLKNGFHYVDTSQQRATMDKAFNAMGTTKDAPKK